MVETELGQATIVYEDPEEGTIEQTVENEHIAYFQDHWLLKTGENDQGQDVVRRIPAQRVYHVERTVEQFEEEITTLRNQFESLTEDIRSRLLGGDESETEEEVHHIDVESGEPVERGSGDR